MKSKNLMIIFAILFIGFFLWISQNLEQKQSITSFADCVAAGNPVMESYPEQCKTPDGRTFVNQITKQQITISGEIVCLPHKDTSGPVTLECAFGLKDAYSTHYGLSDPEFKFLSQVHTGEKVAVSGVFTSTTDSNYAVVGIIEIVALEVMN